METRDIKSMDFTQLQSEIKEAGEPAFRARQIYEWLHKKLAGDFAEMTNLSKGLREKLEEKYQLRALQIADIKISKSDGTRKYLFELNDGNVIESVLMKYRHGNSVCISSQAGCRMGCTFCASAIGGLTRSLLPGEMLDQIYQIQKHSGERVSNIVVMGSGEPLDNYDNLVQFIKMVSDENGLNISQRNITVSTCGLPDQIKKLAEENFQITLALSLHAPNQEKRQELMPVAKAFPIDEVLEACRFYLKKTGRRLTFEYSLVGGINDKEEDARQLASLLSGINGHVNLIPVNPVKENSYRRPDKKTAFKFQNKLEKNGINVTIRREMGQDIDGACGQLRKSYIDQKEREERETGEL